MFGILCFGDSITFGRGEMPCSGWVGRLNDYFEKQDFWNTVYNLGIPGNTSLGLLERFDCECQARIKFYRPEDKFVILVAVGVNDSKWEEDYDHPKVNKKDFENNIKELIEKAKSYQAKLVFIGPTPVDETRTLPFENTYFKNERIMLFNEIIKNNCGKNSVLFLDLFNVLDNWSSLLMEGVHPNSKGYDSMFEKIKEFLVEKEIIK